jgi:hypothetical protein
VSPKGFWWGNLEEREHSGDTGVDGRIIFKMDLQEVGCGGMDWIDVAQGRVLMIAVMKLRVP